jgi:hypothetical protein
LEYVNRRSCGDEFIPSGIRGDRSPRPALGPRRAVARRNPGHGAKIGHRDLAGVRPIGALFDAGEFCRGVREDRDNFYIREAVPQGETVNGWTQMITVTGSRGLVSAAGFSPQKLAAAIGLGFKKACPESFALKDFGAAKFGDRDGYMAVASCGKVNASADGHSETALIIAVQGATDAYTIQWAEHTPTLKAPGVNEAVWRQRLRELMPIRLCAIVPDEAAPYPSCLKQK